MSKVTEIKNAVVTDLAARVAALDAELAVLNNKRKELANMLAHSAGSTSGTFKAGEVTFTVSENNTYPQAALLAALRPGQVRLVQKKTLDTAKVRAMYPDVYAAAKVNNGHKVTIR